MVKSWILHELTISLVNNCNDDKQQQQEIATNPFLKYFSLWNSWIVEGYNSFSIFWGSKDLPLIPEDAWCACSFSSLDESKNFVPKWKNFYEMSLENLLSFLQRSRWSKIYFFHLLFATRYFRFGFLNLFFKEVWYWKCFWEHPHPYDCYAYSNFTSFRDPFLLLVVGSSDLVMDFLTILIFNFTFIN